MKQWMLVVALMLFNVSHAELKTIEMTRDCDKCLGTGNVRTWGTCSACNGSGNVINPVWLERRDRYHDGYRGVRSQLSMHIRCNCAKVIGGRLGKVKVVSVCTKCGGSGKLVSTRTIDMEDVERRKAEEEAALEKQKEEKKAVNEALLRMKPWRFFVSLKYKGAVTYADYGILVKWKEDKQDVTDCPVLRIEKIDSYDYIKKYKGRTVSYFMFKRLKKSDYDSYEYVEFDKYDEVLEFCKKATKVKLNN